DDAADHAATCGSAWSDNSSPRPGVDRFWPSFRDTNPFISCRSLVKNGRRRLPDQHLLFGEFHRSRCLDVAPPNVASKHLLECAGALQESRPDHRQREMAART